jgi:hypothetical protein
MSEIRLPERGNRRLWEREPSTRELSYREIVAGCGPTHIYHRFGIKGGMSRAELLTANLTQNNALLSVLKKKRAAEAAPSSVESS